MLIAIAPLFYHIVHIILGRSFDQMFRLDAIASVTVMQDHFAGQQFLVVYLLKYEPVGTYSFSLSTSKAYIDIPLSVRLEMRHKTSPNTSSF